jgi:hypothetical protein
LEWNIRDQFAQQLQPLPWAFMEELECNIECGTYEINVSVAYKWEISQSNQIPTMNMNYQY